LRGFLRWGRGQTERGLDDIHCDLEAIDLAYGQREMACRGAIRIVLEDGLQGPTQTRRGEFAARDYDACSARRNARSDSGLIAQAAQWVLAGGPAEAERRDAIILNERRKERDGDVRQPEVLGDIAAHVRFVDEQGVHFFFANGLGPIAQDHACRILDAIDSEAKGGEAFELAESLIEFLQRTERVVLLSDEVEIDAGRAHTRLGVGDAEEDHLMPALLQTARKSGHRIDVPGTRETESA
jgi:hypothetical protein